MPLEIPSRGEVVSTLQSYVRTYLPELDPTVTRRRGWIGGMVRSLGSALHDWYVKLKRYADREPFPQTASENFLFGGWWTDITNLTRLPATSAAGRVVMTGTAGSIIPAGTVLNSGAFTYTVDTAAGVVAQTLNISSLTRSGATAIVETTGDHYLATGQTITISGATQTQYNGAFAVTVTAENEFTYAVSGSPATPATGTPIVSGTWGNGLITCTEAGQDTNLDSGTTLSISSPPVGVNSTALVTFGQIGGGSDIEPVETFRERILEALGTDFGMFSAAEIKIVARQIAGVTRVWVIEATDDGSNGVLPGQVKVYFLRDSDANPFPSGIEIEAVRSHIVDSIMPAHTHEEDVMVFSPVALPINFTFSSITPDTPSMRLAIRSKLTQFFSEAVDLGADLTSDDYRCAIKETYDPDRRQALQAFTLSSPSGTITVASDELPRLGDVTF